MALAAAIRKIEKDKNTTYAKIIIGDGDKWDFPARTARLTGRTRTRTVARSVTVAVAVGRFRDAGKDEKERRRDEERERGTGTRSAPRECQPE